MDCNETMVGETWPVASGYETDLLTIVVVDKNVYCYCQLLR